MTSRAPSLEEVIEGVTDKRVYELHTCLPAKILSYDASAQSVTVQITVKSIRRNEDYQDEAMDLGTIQGVPVVFPRCASGWITFPLAEGDLGMVLFSERSLAQWKAKTAGSIVDPKDSNTHTYDGAVFIPGGYPLASPISPAPSTSHVVVHAANELHLGEANPAEFVALATKVLNEFNALKTWVNTHTHPETGATTGVPTVTWSGAGSVAASKVKAK